MAQIPSFPKFIRQSPRQDDRQNLERAMRSEALPIYLKSQIKQDCFSSGASGGVGQYVGRFVCHEPVPPKSRLLIPFCALTLHCHAKEA
jgi:hypothetical protein